jgi:hypothetical protein
MISATIDETREVMTSGSAPSTDAARSTVCWPRRYLSRVRETGLWTATRLATVTIAIALSGCGANHHSEIAKPPSRREGVALRRFRHKADSICRSFINTRLPGRPYGSRPQRIVFFTRLMQVMAGFKADLGAVSVQGLSEEMLPIANRVLAVERGERAMVRQVSRTVADGRPNEEIAHVAFSVAARIQPLESEAKLLWRKIGASHCVQTDTEHFSSSG